MEEDKLTHEVQVNALREKISNLLNLNELLDNENNKNKIKISEIQKKFQNQIEILKTENNLFRMRRNDPPRPVGGIRTEDYEELDNSNKILREIISKFNRKIVEIENVKFYEIIDSIKFLNEQTDGANRRDSGREVWRDLTTAWREAACTLIEAFSNTQKN